MRPYFAIIKDSFRAAMASRVLYVLLALITVLLIALAPLHMRETLDWKLNRQSNVKNPDRLLRRIVERHRDKTDKPVARIWELLPDDTRKKMINIAERPETAVSNKETTRGAPPQVIEDIHTYDELISELNGIIEDPEFYRPEDWEEKLIPTEAEGLIDQGVSSLSEIRGKRLNRLLISTAVSPTIDTGNPTALDFYYAVWKIPITVGITHQQFAQSLTSELPVYFDKFVMSIGLLIAIIVTANMVPETFEPGSLNLLLSKPVSRWGLYTAKFFGGCVFIALCACYLFLGIWIWLGLAMQVWDRAILFSIPLYVIVFSIYFSVSAFVGLLWRSAIVSVILTLMFWAFCFSIGSLFGFFNTKMKNTELISLLPVKNEIYANDVLHQFRTWDEKDNQWDDLLKADLGEQGNLAFGINSFFIPMKDIPALPGLESFLAPVYDQQNDQILASRYEFGQFLSSGKKKMFVANAEKPEFKEVGYFPRDTVKLFDTENGIIAATSDGAFYRLDQKRLEDAIAGVESFEVPESAEAYVTAGRLKTGAELIAEARDLVRKGNDEKVAFGNNDQAIKMAKSFAETMQDIKKTAFTEADQTLFDSERFVVYCELRDGQCAFIAGVPQYNKFTDRAKESLEDFAWLTARELTGDALESGDKLAVGLCGLIKWGAVMTGDPDSSTPQTKTENSEDLDEFFLPPVDVQETMAALQRRRKQADELFLSAGPSSQISIRSSDHVDYSHARNEIAAYQRGTIRVFRAKDDRYEQYGSLEIDLGFEPSMTCRMAYEGDTIMLAFGNGKVITIDAANLQERNEYQPETRSAIELVGGSRDGKRFAVLYRNGNLWTLDTENDSKLQKAKVIGQGDVCTFAFGPNNEFWVSDNTDRATEYDLSTNRTVIRHSPSGGWIERLYRYAIRPFYKICPKPGEFYKVVTHLSSSGDTGTNANVDLNKTLEARDPWSPLWSGLAFMLAMLSLGCLFFQFKDF